MQSRNALGRRFASVLARSTLALLFASCAPGPSSPPLDAGTTDASTERAPHRPPPVSGGSLLVLADDLHAVAADADVDRVYLVTLTSPPTWTTFSLPVGSEPGRIVEDGAGRVHVVLRREGAIATLEPGGTTFSLRPVCAAPRGIAWRASDDALIVACVEGLLVTLSAAGGPPTRSLTLEDDLRDVVVSGDRVLVSRFRSAEVLAVEADGTIGARWTPATVDRLNTLGDGSGFTATFAPQIAWRMIATEGGALVLHQRARTTPILARARASGDDGTSYGGDETSVHAPCIGGIIEESVSFVDASAPSGTLVATPALPVGLATDLAWHPGRQVIRIMQGELGGQDPTSIVQVPQLWVASAGLSPEGDALPALLAPLDQVLGGERCYEEGLQDGAVRATSVAITRAGDLLMLTRSPVTLVRAGANSASSGSGALERTVLDETPLDPGHDIFHTITPSGAACASCHAEGGDDGHVWAIGEGTPVRTQSLSGPVMGSAPFHWAGDLAQFPDLVQEVWRSRMSGPHLSTLQIVSLAGWIESMDAPPRAAGDPDAIARGRTLFESPDLGCSSCHSGATFSDGASADVGTGGSFQVPMLIGVAFRAPYMHSGCAPTLRARFDGDEACTGGDLHGHTSHLDDRAVDDLVAFLRSL